MHINLQNNSPFLKIHKEANWTIMLWSIYIVYKKNS